MERGQAWVRYRGGARERGDTDERGGVGVSPLEKAALEGGKFINVSLKVHTMEGVWERVALSQAH